MSDKDKLVGARKRAEAAVQDMAEGPLKIAAFETILRSLLEQTQAPRSGSGPIREPEPQLPKAPKTLPERILLLRSQDFFNVPRSLGELKAELATNGWYYPLTTLSGAMQSLVQKRNLRRQKMPIGKKRIWTYSNV